MGGCSLILSSDITIIPDVLLTGSTMKGSHIPSLPEPDIQAGEIVKPAHLDRLPEDIKEKILSWHVEGLPSRKMALLLRKDGYDCNHLRLWRWCKNQFRGPVQKDGEPTTNIEEIRLELEKKAVYSAIDLCIETLHKAKAPEIKNATDVDKIVGALAKAVSAMAARKRVEYEAGEAVKHVRDKLKVEFQKLMSGHPEVVAQVHAILEEASEKIQIDG